MTTGVVPAAASRPAAGCALGVALANLGYATSFLIVRPHNADAAGTAASAFLLAGGLLAVPVLIALYRATAERSPELSLVAAALGLAGAIASAIHGGYDLAAAVHHTPLAGAANAPSQIDPRGLMTFGVSALSLLCFAAALRADSRFPGGLANLAALLGGLLLIIYGCRLAVLSTHNPALVAAAGLAGFVVSPAWYASLALVFQRGGGARRLA